MPTHLPAFVVTAWLLAMLPGAGQALILRQTLTRGLRAAWTSIAGTATGLLVWSTLAAAGLSAVLLANPAAYLVVRVAGGLVLGYLGISSLRTMRRTMHSHRPGEPAAAGADRGAYLAGLATNLGNPKAGVFAVSLIPQFILPGGHVFASGVLLGVTWAVTSASWYLVFVWVVDRGRSFVSRPSVTTWLHGITGTVLLMLGVAVVGGV
jgi:threonine/homoserine/homoserine lactone efflux protein